MCCKMRLDQALKLYIGLYCVCFMVSWFVSVPMLMHVSREDECLLFVTRDIVYGTAGGNFKTYALMMQLKFVGALKQIFKWDLQRKR